MDLKELLLAELNREVDRSRRALEQVPDDKFDWKPHERSMQFGYLIGMVATIPSWVAMQVTKPDLDIAPVDGPKVQMEPLKTSAQLLAQLDKTATEARAALEGTTDEHLKTNWQLKVKGQVVMEAPRFEMIQDTINHWVHHRGQSTVYLRLMGAKVPAIYGPSADEQNFR
ncbi:MAG TPA: DinB family protein [Gemmatimonadaceae bacterium]|nr:DinB family protein [Gemmatimonadaceae bacterium]